MSREISFKYKPPLKFQDQFVTATGEVRATVEFRTFDTLWFNTGTLCNLTCSNCYIESSPLNDSLVYISIDEVSNYLDELDELQDGSVEPTVNEQPLKSVVHSQTFPETS